MVNLSFKFQLRFSSPSNYYGYASFYSFSEADLLVSQAIMNGQNPYSSHESNFFRNRLLRLFSFVLLMLFWLQSPVEVMLFFFFFFF